jgi:UDP-N-acetylglucosamine diphosphorylase/glucosamine-1-phosphate N-acetyltransferase
MENIILFDDETRDFLLPLTFTRPVAELRIGILTISEKWAKRLGGKVSWITEDYLSELYPIKIASDNLVISSSWIPNDQLARLVKQLEPNEALLDNDSLVAARLGAEQFDRLVKNESIDELTGYELSNTQTNRIANIWDIIRLNAAEIESDYEFLTKGKESERINDSNNIIGRNQVFLGEKVTMDFATINATDGPVFIEEGATVMEGAIIKGPVAICKNAIIKMGAKIYGGTTIGPFSKAGGEIGNSILTGYSNKGHDGYLGDSVLGEWCNIGADSNTSNLKNNYQNIKLWSYPDKKFIPSGMQFAGLFMGDHSKCGINSMFNTGTVMGVSCNIYGSGFPRTFIPSFTWGGASGFKTYRFDKALETMKLVMKRRSKTMSEQEEKMYQTVYEKTSAFRKD